MHSLTSQIDSRIKKLTYLAIRCYTRCKELIPELTYDEFAMAFLLYYSALRSCDYDCNHLMYDLLDEVSDADSDRIAQCSLYLTSFDLQQDPIEFEKNANPPPPPPGVFSFGSFPFRFSSASSSSSSLPPLPPPPPPSSSSSSSSQDIRFPHDRSLLSNRLRQIPGGKRKKTKSKRKHNSKTTRMYA